MVEAGDKIAQLVVYPLIQPNLTFADEVTETSRGDKGFGSSDQVTESESAADNTTTSRTSSKDTGFTTLFTG